MTKKETEEILIVSIIPYFLKRGVFWFTQNYEKIKKAAQSQIWWKENVLFLEKDLKINLFALLRRLTELGYKKVQTLGAPGEFSQHGGILDIFPINSSTAWRLEFSGNKIGDIKTLPVKILKKEKEINKDLTGRQPQSLIAGLKPGNFLVHLDHGIGVFLGFAERPGGSAELTHSRAERGHSRAQRGEEISEQPPTEISHDKFFVLQYAKNDRLYVPLDLEQKLSHYIGFETPIVHRLGGTLWFKTKRRAKENALELAKELLELYAQRSVSRGFQYPPDNDWQKELEGNFPYVETDDQAAAIAEVKRDMESDRPMDRLVCGDVGFGKTEVALRAAFKAINAGQQVALLAPTTILANQHFATFSGRLKKFPVRVALLTRLQPKSQQRKIIKETAESKIDIIIGTHRLLSSDVSFKNLGLVIIDEEQRFGVRQKELFKKWKKDIDILSLTATPIPRTLHLALAGLRDISTISTPPAGRLAIKTSIQPFNQKIIKEAIVQELKRGGQVYYLHNRVETIELAAQQIKRLVPTAKIAHIHGRLPEKQLVKIMDEFGRDSSPSFLKSLPRTGYGEGWGGFKKIPPKRGVAPSGLYALNPPLQRGKSHIDVLVATTIIENGLDFPNVNTLIVANASRLGLAQAYQIRGRIGRSHHQAFAYFLYNAKHLTNDARSRLEALKEAEALGSGYQIALRDLEIRGAGNILGREQSGPINAVGLNLYMQILNESIEELKESNRL